MMLRVRAASLVLLILALGAGFAEAQSPCGATVNPIVCENQKVGDSATQWDIVGAGDASLQGFATDISVNLGGTVHFKVSTTAPTYGMDIYRMGYYGGFGARKVASIATIAGQAQPPCLTDTATGLVDCSNWTESASWTVPATSVSGIYFARLRRADTGGASHIVFIVRDDAGHSDLLFQTSDTTWQAYNRYGGNSLYVGSPAGRAYKVSYNRPFTTRTDVPITWLFDSEYPMVRWLEANGYNVSYFTGVDSDRLGAELLEHKVFLSVGHDEYWSGTQRANVEAARSAGVHLTFLSGNEVFWKTRWENDATGASRRTLVCYKETHAGAKIDPTAAWTGSWRDARFSPPADGGRPENALTGTLFMVNGSSSGSNAPMQVPPGQGKLRFWRNTGVATTAAGGGTTTFASGMLGYEWDVDADNGSRPAGIIHLSASTWSVGALLVDNGSTYAPGVATHNLTLYRHSSGALVFGAGTIRWPWGLDGTHDVDAAGPTPSQDIKQATVNLFADMGVQPQTLQPGLIPASMSTDLAPPASSIAFPANGQTFPLNTSITISGTATDAGGGLVASVEVSVDGGVTWQPATGTGGWTFSWTPTAVGASTIVSRSVDDSANREAPVSAVTVTIGSGGQGTLGLTSTGSQADSGQSGVMNGSKVTTTVASQVTSMSAYVGVIDSSAANQQFQLAIYTDNAGKPGTLVAASVTGTLVANRWNTVAVSAALQPASTYWFLYNTNGRTSTVNNMFFNTGTAGQGVFGNGAQAFGTWPATFPASTISNAVYSLYATLAPDTTPPIVTSITPPAGATSVLGATTVTATFNEDMSPASLTPSTFVLRDPAAVAVSATVTYNSATHTATLTPSAVLSGSTTYTATVVSGPSGVKDTAGNALANNSVWSFTTAVADTTAPTVTGMTPPNNATGVSAGTAVTATFSEDINAATLTSATFVLRDPANAIVAAAVSYNAASRVATLTPSATLGASKRYTATITGGASGVKDPSGNALAASAVWSFTTGATATLGLTTVGAAQDDGEANWMNGSKVTTGSQAVSVISMSVHVGPVDTAPNNQYQLAIYADSAGVPGARIASSASGTLTANAWNTVPVSAALQPATTYWLVYNTNGRPGAVNNMQYNAGTLGAGAFSNSGVTFGTWPAAFGSATKTTTIFSLYVTTDAGPVDSTPPAVAITAPAPSAAVSGVVAVTATASDNIGVAGVQFFVDQVALGAEATLAPYAASWDTSLVSNGLHSLTAIARDANGNTATSSVVTVTTSNTSHESAVGVWAPLLTWPIVAIHGSLMRTGSVLVWDGENTTTHPLVWNPANNALTSTPAVANELWCAGNISLVNGKIFVAGGHAPNTGENGIATGYTYDPIANSWASTTSMSYARWYPSVTTLSDGRVAIVSGQITQGIFADVPEIYDPLSGSMTAIPSISTSQLREEEYPSDFHLPDGRILAISPQWGPVQLFDPLALSWTAVNTTPIILGSAVQFRPGKILMAGGGSAFLAPASTSAAVLDMTVPTPTWRTTARLALGRFHNTLVMLPTGKVLSVGGADVADQVTPTGPLPVEQWDPDTEQWTTLASMAVPRVYHSIALLLPDGRVLAAGGGHNHALANAFSAQVYSPPYLFKGARPTIASAPDTVAYNTSFTVSSPEASGIATVSLLDVGSATHATMMGQSYRELAFTKTAGQLTITAPLNGDQAPPGYYMLFLVDANGVPSVAKILKIAAAADSTPPVVTMTSPGTPVSGAITLGATASDAGGVAKVEFYVDAVLVGADATSPYAMSFDTATLANGPHTLTAKAYDIANNVATSAPISVTFANVVATPVIAPNGGSFAGSVSVTLTTPTSGATIRYTLDGADPTATSAVYSVALTLTSSGTVKARAFRSGLTDSAVAAATFTVTAPPPTLGMTTIGTTADSGDNNYLNGSLVTTTTAGAITTMSVYVGAIDTSTTNRQFQVAIYTNNGTVPGTLVAKSLSGTLVANSWNTIAISATLQASTKYWLIYNTNGRTDPVNNMLYSSAGAGQSVFSSATVAFGTWPATFPAAVLHAARFSIYATFGP